MKRILLLAAAVALGSMFAERAYAHGGSYRGPNGGVPPGLREPSDPEPPPPPPSDPGQPSGPTTPGDPAPAGPTTPSDPGHTTPGDPGGPQPVGPSGGPAKKKSTSKAVTFESWRYWWAYNNADILNLKDSIYAARTSSSSPMFFASGRDEENRRNAQRPTQAAIQSSIIPAEERRLQDPRDHEDIHGGAIVALGKVGSVKYIPVFKDAMHNQFRNEKGEKVDFGLSATESAALALGLLPELDEKGKEAARQICLDAIENKDLRRRDRTWAAVALGLQRDTEAIRPLLKKLETMDLGGDNNDNVVAGILCGIGLIGLPQDQEVAAKLVGELTTAFEKRQLFGREISERIQAFVGYAIMKLEPTDEACLKTMLKVLGSRSAGQIAKRSAAIAIGVLGAKTLNADLKKEAVNELQKYIRKSGGDASGANFSIIALSQIGTPEAIESLKKLAEEARPDQKPFAALGLATHLFYKERAAANGGEAVDPKFKADILAHLQRLTEKFKDADTQAAFYLSRGILKDRSAIEEMTLLAADPSKDPTIRGFSCVALGLIGDASDKVKEALKIALTDRKIVDLKRDAATGLGLLRDAEVVKVLLDELKQAKSFAVQTQVIQAIGTIGDHTAIDPLVEILDNKNESAQTRAMAAVGLGMIGDLQTIPKLDRLGKNFNYRATVDDLTELLYIL
ncbi:MAG: HEAT repeat domain-containing protein [Planctomycetota bacterium]